MKILIVDNFDSFTYNLVHYVKEFSIDVKVLRNNEISLKNICNFDKIILSPGTGLPFHFPILKEIIKKFYKKKSILGVCLGHQAIAETFDCHLFNLNKVSHGLQRKTIILDKKDKLFKNVPDIFLSARYHSWAVSKEFFSKDLKITAIDEKGVIMAISHKKYNLKGVQFHPESIMTIYGKNIIKNFLFK